MQPKDIQNHVAGSVAGIQTGQWQGITQHPKPCPTCGTCPTCGAKSWTYQPQITWGGTGYATSEMK